MSMLEYRIPISILCVSAAFFMLALFSRKNATAEELVEEIVRKDEEELKRFEEPSQEAKPQGQGAGNDDFSIGLIKQIIGRIKMIEERLDEIELRDAGLGLGYAKKDERRYN